MVHPDPITLNVFGDRLFALRRSRRLLQKQVAHSSGIDPSYLAGLEHGRRAPPRTAVLNRILDVLMANDSERAELTQAAALSKLLRVMQEDAIVIPGTRTLTRLALAIPTLTEEELDALNTLIDGICRRHSNG